MVNLAPHKVCYVCVEDLRKWSKKEKQAFRFAIPMIWREPTNHCNDYYFCSVNVSGYNTINKSVISYPNLPSVMRPVGHDTDLPVPIPSEYIHHDILPTDASGDANEMGNDLFECKKTL